MITCAYDGDPIAEPRSHPWTDAASSAAHRYYDLKAHPALIRTALEDFVPFEQHAAIDGFYTLLEWLNAEGGKGSILESNDCAFSGPEENEHASMARRRVCSGRLMVMYRALARNVSLGAIDALTEGLHRRLAVIDPQLEWGIVGTTLVPVRYLALAELPGNGLGQQLMISFWAWGHSDAEVMVHLGRVVSSLSQALRQVSADLREACS